MTLTELVAHIATEFRKCFGHSPRWIVSAPGRVNVIGEHTDYNDGFVLPMAIERYAIMAADAVIVPWKTTIYDTQFKETALIDVSTPVTKGDPKWSNYIRGVLAGFQNRGVRIPALDVAFLSTVPLGGGLSSSAALEVCTGTLMEAATGKRLTPSRRRCSHRRPSMILPACPVASWTNLSLRWDAKGHLLLLDCRTAQNRTGANERPVRHVAYHQYQRQT